MEQLTQVSEDIGTVLLQALIAYVETVWSTGKHKVVEDQSRDRALTAKLGEISNTLKIEFGIDLFTLKAENIAVYLMQEVYVHKDSEGKQIAGVMLNRCTRFPELKAAAVETFLQLIK